MVIEDNFTGHYERDEKGDRLAINVIDLISKYDQLLKEKAIKFRMPAVSAETALSEITYVFDDTEFLHGNVYSFVDLLASTEEGTDTVAEEKYISEVTDVLLEMINMFIDKLKVMELFSLLINKELSCSLNIHGGEHFIYLLTPK